MIDRRGLLRVAALAALCSTTRPVHAADRHAPVIGRLRDWVAAGALPFASLRIAQRGRVQAEVHLSGVARVAPDSLFRIHSMTKPVVAAGLLLLLEDRRLALEDPVAKHVPEFAALQVLSDVPDRSAPAQTMTVAHLLTHRCGLANSWGPARVAARYRAAGLIAGAWMYDPGIGSLDQFARRLATIPLEFQPGSNWLYGYGLDLAGLIIERLSGMRLGRFLAQRIFTPLGMASTGYFVPEDRRADLAGLFAARDGKLEAMRDGSEALALRRPQCDAGSAGLVSTLEDYGRFADMLANGGAREGVRVMQPASARLLTTPYGAQAGSAEGLEQLGRYAPGSVAQALGGVVRLDDRGGPGSAGEYSWGGAAGTGFWCTPGLGLSVTLMTQRVPAAPTVRETLRPMIYTALVPSG